MISKHILHKYEYSEKDIHNILCDFANRKKNYINCHLDRFSWLQQAFNNARFINYLVYRFFLKKIKITVKYTQNNKYPIAIILLKPALYIFGLVFRFTYFLFDTVSINLISWLPSCILALLILLTAGICHT